jgi:hypothetical protein
VLDVASIFDHRADFDPAGDFAAFLRRVPARWVVYLLTDQLDQPVQLLCVKNLRASLKRRLSGLETVGLSKKVNYREVVRRVYWRRVDSGFEADWVYLESARHVFARTYQGMVGFRPAWFVHVNPDARFPRYTKTTDLTARAGMLIGPVEDKHAAGRLVALAEDAFDLCRYYNILTEAPRGKACAYKEMGKCPAPCDGSISMDQYRGMMARSAAVMISPGEFLEELTRRMQSAAAALQFEAAGKIKVLMDPVSQFGQGPFRHVRRLEGFVFLGVQRGPGPGPAKLFLITPGGIEEIAGLIDEPVGAAELLEYVSGRAGERAACDMTVAGIERMGLVAHHLFSSRQTQGFFLRLDALDEKLLAKAFREQIVGAGHAPPLRR